MNSDDTIAAISSTAAPAARIIVRLSGPAALQIAAELCPNFSSDEGNTARRLSLVFANLTVPAWLYLFRSPRSYTGQNLVEFHLPGNPVLARLLLQDLCSRGARQAEAGEFTARAYFNGKIDLTEAEGVAATIAAGNEQELAAARQLAAGELARRLAPITDLVAETLALVEVGIDFSEEDLSFLTGPQLSERIARSTAMLDRLLNESVRFERLAHEPQVVLVGRPNAGKSTLLNALAGHDRAVVSPLAGTTRDALSAEVSLARGIVRLIDVAGIEDHPSSNHAPLPPLPPGEGWGEGTRGGRNLPIAVTPTLSRGERGQEVVPHNLGISTDEITHQMQRQSLRALESADIVLWVQDITDSRPHVALSRSPSLVVLTKSDLCEVPPAAHLEHLPVCAVSGEGLSELRSRLDILCFGSASPGSALALNIRHVQAIEEAKAALHRATERLPLSAPELLAFELREALDALGRVSGAVTPDDVLGKIFSAFCIGK